MNFGDPWGLWAEGPIANPYWWLYAQAVNQVFGDRVFIPDLSEVTDLSMLDIARESAYETTLDHRELTLDALMHYDANCTSFFTNKQLEGKSWMERMITSVGRTSYYRLSEGYNDEISINEAVGGTPVFESHKSDGTLMSIAEYHEKYYAPEGVAGWTEGNAVFMARGFSVSFAGGNMTIVRPSSLIHEQMHIGLEMGDIDIADALGLAVPDGGTRIERIKAASTAIADWLRRGCN